MDLLETQRPVEAVLPAQAAVNTLIKTEDAKHVTHNKLSLDKLEANTALKCQSVELDSQETLAPTNVLEQQQDPAESLAMHHKDRDLTLPETNAFVLPQPVVLVSYQWTLKEDVNAHATYSGMLICNIAQHALKVKYQVWTSMVFSVNLTLNGNHTT